MEGLAGALKGWFTEAASCHPLSWFPSVFTLRLLVLLSSHLSFLSICFHSLIDCVKMQKVRALPAWWLWPSGLGSTFTLLIWEIGFIVLTLQDSWEDC